MHTSSTSAVRTPEVNENVLISTILTQSGHVFGRATLNSRGNINALSLSMVDRLSSQLDIWAKDHRVVGVVLDGAGPRGFCAGGDVVGLYHAICDAERGQVPAAAAAFFEREYRLDYRIHTFQKPVLCWAHGIVMGGGVGLMSGASHRIVTPSTRLAMPEVTIGLYPDVGASWFLGAMPGRTGLFLGLTGASLNAADAMYAGLADFTMPDDKKSDLLDTISNAGWFGAQMADRDQLTDILANCNAVDDVPLSSLQILRARIDGVMQPDTLEQIAKRLRGLADDGEPWLSRAGSTFAKGSPSSVALTYELSNRSKQVSLAEVLRLEYLASIGCMMKSDFSEGVRALLVDKDKEPRWQPAVLDLVSRAHVEDHLVPRFKGEHPLADLN